MKDLIIAQGIPEGRLLSSGETEAIFKKYLILNRVLNRDETNDILFRYNIKKTHYKILSHGETIQAGDVIYNYIIAEYEPAGSIAGEVYSSRHNGVLRPVRFL